jgi:hypothetical protein
MITILHHLGLGDQIMLNGMVRYLAENDTVCIFVQKHQIDSTEFMYKDIKDRVVIKSVNTTNAREMWEQVEGEILPLATYKLPTNVWNYIMEGPPSDMVNWAHSVYIQACVPPKYMYSRFKVIRDNSREIKYDSDDYVFVHDDHSRGMVVDVNHKDVFRPDITKTTNIFDYLMVIENAKEVHCMDSSFAWMIELLGIGSPKKNFLHLNTKGNYNIKMVKTVFSDDVWTYV